MAPILLAAVMYAGDSLTRLFRAPTRPHRDGSRRDNLPRMRVYDRTRVKGRNLVGFTEYTNIRGRTYLIKKGTYYRADKLYAGARLVVADA